MAKSKALMPSYASGLSSPCSRAGGIGYLQAFLGGSHAVV